jgi:hypothetical protein
MIDNGPAAMDGPAGDRVVNPGSDSNGPNSDTGPVVDTGGAGGTGGADAFRQPSDSGGVAIDGPAMVDSTSVSEAGGLFTDGPSRPDGSADAPGIDTRPDMASVNLTVNAGADKMACSGFAVLLGPGVQGGGPPYEYLWTADPACTDCISKPNLVQTTVNPNLTTTFTITVKDSLGATASDSLVVTVPSPVADAGLETATDPGGSVQIGTTGLAGYSYSWTCDRPTCALSSTSVARPTVKPSLSTQYTVTATSPEGCIATDSTTIWVNLPVGTTPAEGDTYPRSGSLFVQFGAEVASSSLSTDTIILRESVSDTPVAFDYSYDAPSRVLVISPKGDNYNASIGAYTLTLVGGKDGIQSSDPIRPQRLADDRVVKYTVSGTADTTGPSIVTRSPTSGAVAVPTNASVSAVWSEALDPTSVNATSFSVSAGLTNLAGSVSYDPETFTVTFVPNAALAASTSYTVKATGIKDVVGNSALATSWSFTSGVAADSAPPTVTAVVPASGATKVSVGSRVTVTFNEPVKAASVVGAVQVVAGGTAIAGSVEYDAVAGQAVFTPAGLLSKQTTYTVTVSGVQDTAGNTMSTAFTSTFTTANLLFSDTFESGTAKWTLTGTWGLTTSVSASPTHSLTDSPDGNYSGAATSVTSTAIDVTGFSSLTLSYWLSGSIAMYDSLRVEYSTGGYGWTTAANLTGDLGKGIRTHVLTLGSAATQLLVRFRMMSGPYSTTRADGAYIDDVLVQAN